MDTAHARLKAHLAEYMYKRGANKGAAPADQYRRSYDKHRVYAHNDGTMRVRFWYTDLITAYPDGRIVICTAGYEKSPATGAAMRQSLSRFSTFSCVFQTVHKFSVTQAVVKTTANPEGFVFYEGMEFDAQGNLLTPVKPYRAKRINREETKELRDELAASGFKTVFKLLHAAAKEEDRRPTQSLNTHALPTRTMRDVLINPEEADLWPEIVARYAFVTGFSIQSGVNVKTTSKIDASQTWRDLMKALTAGMYEYVYVKPE